MPGFNVSAIQSLVAIFGDFPILSEPFESSIGHCSTSTIHLLAHTWQAKYWQLSQSLKGWQYLQPVQRSTAFSLSIVSLQIFITSLILLIS
jgi:hypothetical protein